MTIVEGLLERLERAYGDEGQAPSPSLTETTEAPISVIVSDVSARGARLSGDGLPVQDAHILLMADDLVIEGRVAWSIGTACGIEFRQELSPSCHSNVQRRGMRGQLTRL